MSARPRILIVTSGNPSRNPRPVKEAETLGRAGYDVTLLTPFGDPTAIPFDRILLASAPYRHVRLDPESGISPRLRRWILSRAVPLGLQPPSLLGATKALLRAAEKSAADLTIVHNEAPHWVGARLLPQNRLVAADFEDWHSEDLLPSERGGRPLSLLRKTERTLLSSAAYVSTTSHAMADALYQRYGGKQAHVVTNSFPLQPAAMRRSPNEPPAFFWFSQTIGPGRGLEAFLSAWRRTRYPSTLALLGKVRPGFDSQLLSALPPGFRSRVRVKALVSAAELPAVIAEHDIGLALEEPSILNRDLTITNKILQYLNAGLAIVASNTAGQREVLAQQPAAGLIISDTEPDRYANALDGLLADPDSLATRRAAARRLAEARYNWEIEAERLENLVTQALATRGISVHR